MHKVLLITLSLIASQFMLAMEMEEDPSIKAYCLDSALVKAIRQNEEKKVEELLAQGANPNTTYRYHRAPATPLGWAAHLGHTKIAELLIKNGAEVDSTKNHEGGRAIHLACADGHHEVVQLLIAHGANVHTPNRFEHPPLEHAICSGSTEIVRTLLD